MLEISELIYETCKTYLITQGKFILLLWVFIAVIIVAYFGWLAPVPGKSMGVTVPIILMFSLVGIAGSYGVAWFGIRVNTFANSRTAFAGLRGKPYPIYEIPLKAGMSIGMLLISVELLIMLFILLFVPGDYAGPCFIGFAIGESLGAAALRIAGGIFTKIADIGSDLMKIVFKIKEDDARNPGVIADCTGDNAGDSVGPSADGFETYGVTGVALITFILLAVKDPDHPGAVAGVDLRDAHHDAGFERGGILHQRRDRQGALRQCWIDMNFEAPLTSLVWITSIVSIVADLRRFGPDYSRTERRFDSVVETGFDHFVRHAGGRRSFRNWSKSSPRPNPVTFAKSLSRRKKAALRSEFFRGWSPAIFRRTGWAWRWCSLMSLAYYFSTSFRFARLMLAPAVFAFGLVAFGFLGMGPVTIAVDSYGPVTDNAQSVYELSLIEQVPNVEQDIKKNYGFDVNFSRAKDMLEENDGAGNTFKATAKPVLIGTAVVGATTMIFSIIMALTNGLTSNVDSLSLLHAPFVLGLITGGAMIYWFTGASMQAVTTGAYRAVEFIKANIRLDGVEKASVSDSKKVVEICTQYAQKGMFNIFLAVFLRNLGVRFCRTVLLYRLPDLDCDLRPVPGNLHG